MLMSYANNMSPQRADADLASSLRLSVMRLARRLRLEKSSDSLSMNQLAALGTLNRCGDLTVGELAGIEKVKPPSMTRTINSLADAGLVTRQAHPTDGRQVLVGLTPDARHVLDEDRRRRDAWLAKRLADLNPDQRALLREVAPLLDALAST
jgi:DNA-binding MarR family transcriptional regulator